jgi:hypothetical protein
MFIAISGVTVGLNFKYMKIEVGCAKLQRALFENVCTPFENSFELSILEQLLAQSV